MRDRNFPGKSMCLKAWCETLGIPIKYHTITARMLRGMSFEEAISKPIRKSKKSLASSEDPCASL